MWHHESLNTSIINHLVCIFGSCSRNQFFQTKSSPPLGDGLQKRSKFAVQGYMAEGCGQPAQPLNTTNF